MISSLARSKGVECPRNPTNVTTLLEPGSRIGPQITLYTVRYHSSSSCQESAIRATLDLLNLIVERSKSLGRTLGCRILTPQLASVGVPSALNKEHWTEHSSRADSRFQHQKKEIKRERADERIYEVYGRIQREENGSFYSDLARDDIELRVQNFVRHAQLQQPYFEKVILKKVAVSRKSRYS